MLARLVKERLVSCLVSALREALDAVVEEGIHKLLSAAGKLSYCIYIYIAALYQVSYK